MIFLSQTAERHVKLKFSKMHGLGNDFVVLDGVRQQVSLSPEQLVYLWPTATSVSAVTRSCWSRSRASPASISATASSMPMAARSSSAAMAPAASCVSCMTRADRQAADSRRDPEGHHRAASRGRWQCHRRHGRAALPAGRNSLPGDDDVIIHLLDVADETLETTVVSMGNPHAVQVVDNVDTHPVGAHGP